MRTFIHILLFVIGLTLPLGCDNNQNPEKLYQLNPSWDKQSPTGVYIPRNLEDCFQELKKMLPPELISDIKRGTERDMIRLHLNIGMWIRNYWGLWKGSRLSEYFNRIGIKHPDDMSSIILNSYWRHLHGQPIKLKDQIDLYKAYWTIIKKILQTHHFYPARRSEA